MTVAPWSVIPFVALLACIAVLPLVAATEHAWERNRVKLAVALLLAQARPNPLFKAFAAAMALMFAALIGVSRVDLGVHWPTDILAGWALGVTWTALCWAALWCQT